MYDVPNCAIRRTGTAITVIMDDIVVPEWEHINKNACLDLSLEAVSSACDMQGY